MVVPRVQWFVYKGGISFLEMFLFCIGKVKHPAGRGTHRMCKNIVTLLLLNFFCKRLLYPNGIMDLTVILTSVSK
jgi:hypothetical protein